MQTPNRITLVLRPIRGGTFESVLPFVKLGAPVAIGRGLGVIASCSDRDALEELQLLENQLVLAEAAIKRGVRPGSGLRIDAWIATVHNARRYEFLRDRERIKDPDEDLLVVRGDNWLSGEELDREVDTAIRLDVPKQQAVQEQQP